jgi:hypothetical protein
MCPKFGDEILFEMFLVETKFCRSIPGRIEQSDRLVASSDTSLRTGDSRRLLQSEKKQKARGQSTSSSPVGVSLGP